MIPRPLVLLILAALPACVDARAPSDAPACKGAVECKRLYEDAQKRLQACLREQATAGYVSTAVTSPRECDSVQAETNGLASAIARFHEKHPQEPEEERGQGFEVPALPPAKGTAAP